MLNQFVLQGRLTRDPELRTTQSGTSVCSFTVAWSEKYKETETQLFMDCSAWRGTGEMVSKYFTKGKEILVEGKLRTDKWKDKDGNDRTSIKMTVERVHFCGPKGGSSSAAVPTDGHSDFAEVEDDGKLPF
jgi:single-strand DNA-binding protein